MYTKSIWEFLWTTYDKVTGLPLSSEYLHISLNPFWNIFTKLPSRFSPLEIDLLYRRKWFCISSVQSVYEYNRHKLKVFGISPSLLVWKLDQAPREAVLYIVVGTQSSHPVEAQHRLRKAPSGHCPHERKWNYVYLPLYVVVFGETLHTIHIFDT